MRVGRSATLFYMYILTWIKIFVKHLPVGRCYYYREKGDEKSPDASGLLKVCRKRESNPHAFDGGGFWVIQAIRNLMAWTGIKRSFPSLSKTSKTRKSLIKSAFSTQSTKSTSNSSPPRLSATRYPIWGAGGMLEGCKQDIPPANSYRGHTH